jgi:hypothetical protein
MLRTGRSRHPPLVVDIARGFEVPRSVLDIEDIITATAALKVQRVVTAARSLQQV